MVRSCKRILQIDKNSFEIDKIIQLSNGEHLIYDAMAVINHQILAAPRGQGELHIFSKINRIGKGAFEYMRTSNIQFKNDTTIAFLDYNLEKVIEYSVKGKSLNEIQVPSHTDQINYSQDGTLYTAFSYPDYFSNNFNFVKNLDTDDNFFPFEPKDDINTESIRSMSTTSNIDFYIDDNKIMEYWCFGINKIFSASTPDKTNILCDISIDNSISRPIVVDNESLYFFVLNQGGIVNFLYTKSNNRLKSFQFSGNQGYKWQSLFRTIWMEVLLFFRCLDPMQIRTLIRYLMQK